MEMEMEMVMVRSDVQSNFVRPLEKHRDSSKEFQGRLIDFGLVRSWRNKDGSIIPARESAEVRTIAIPITSSHLHHHRHARHLTVSGHVEVCIFELACSFGIIQT